MRLAARTGVGLAALWALRHLGPDSAAAQRLTGWSDNRGHSGSYVLDAMGNRLSEDIRDAQGQTAWKLARTINSLNRVASTTVGSAGAPVTYGYNANGDLTSATQTFNSAARTTQWQLDALRRVAATTSTEGATASVAYNGLDDITKATDFKQVATNYTRDALGNAKAMSNARRLVYVEDQYLWGPEVGAHFADALRDNPDLRLVIVLPVLPDLDGTVSRMTQWHARRAALGPARAWRGRHHNGDDFARRALFAHNCRRLPARVRSGRGEHREIDIFRNVWKNDINRRLDRGFIVKMRR